MPAAAAAPREIEAARLTAATAAIFTALGINSDDAQSVAGDLVAANLEGIPSHGVMLVPLYVDRLLNGSVSKRSVGEVVNDDAGAIVIDAGNALGQLTARQAVRLAVARAREYGLAAVAVRNAFHFGTAGRYARMMAAEGCVGMVMSNTRPLMPPPGGAQALAGNNPIAIALPSAGDFPVEVDMALSASAMGNIRLAAAAGEAIPSGWAVDSEGRPTTNPAEAIKGMLLPAAGPKGFGLAFAIDLLCGGLSDGAIGAEVRPLYGDPKEPYRCAHFFLAVYVGHFLDKAVFAERVCEAALRVSSSKRSPGVDRVYAPGELVWARKQASGSICRIDAPTVRSLAEAAARAGVRDFEAMLLNGASMR
jgi:LDH2 family malate/lactate/ureidoglycolate dehydrogenase